jgi:hypothetical protein
MQVIIKVRRCPRLPRLSVVLGRSAARAVLYSRSRRLMTERGWCSM